MGLADRVGPCQGGHPAAQVCARARAKPQKHSLEKNGDFVDDELRRLTAGRRLIE
jgi:hypothetical protein